VAQQINYNGKTYELFGGQVFEVTGPGKLGYTEGVSVSQFKTIYAQQQNSVLQTENAAKAAASPAQTKTFTGSTQAEQQQKNPFLDASGNPYLSPTQTSDLISAYEKQINDLQKIPESSWTTEQSNAWKEAKLNLQALNAAITDKCIVRERSAGSWTIKGTPDCEQFNKSVTYKNLVRLTSVTRSLPDPCGKSTLSKINVSLYNFFNKLKVFKKYGELYVNGAINSITSVTNLIRSTSAIIAGVLKTLVQRIRNFILNEIRKRIEQVIDYILTNLAKVLKDVLLQEIIQVIMCKFDDIIKGLSKLVSDFLFGLIGNVINSGFCAAEQFTNALINNLAASIDQTLGPILDSISDVLGGIGKIAGSVFKAIDFILGFESFLCAAPNCPQIKDFEASPWVGASKTKIDAFSNFKVPTGDEIVGAVDTWFSGLSIFGSKIGDSQDALPSSITCNTAAFRCGPPNIEFFGGGGAGAFGDAVVNTIGQVVGVNLSFGGAGYTSPPFVTFRDSCGNGNYASGYTEINDAGEVTKVIMVNNGNGYLDSPNGLDEFGNSVNTGGTTNAGGTGTGGTTNAGGTDTTGTTNAEGAETMIKTFVSCIDEFKVLSTGIGYSVEDTVTITPDAPGLNVRITMNEEGQIIALNIISPSCGLTEVPKVTINSATGAGADIQPILKFYTLDAYNELQDNNYKSQELVQVIDCVYPR
jgi:hypothetical protein